MLTVGGWLTAYASIPDSGGVIHGCYNKGNGSLRVAGDPGAASLVMFFFFAAIAASPSS